MSADTRLEELDVSGPGEVDEPQFPALAERHRRELHVHCYRMLGSFEDAEDTVQETFLRAWRRRETFEGRSTFRAWLYRIATDACPDLLAKCRPEPATGGEVPWLRGVAPAPPAAAAPARWWRPVPPGPAAATLWEAAGPGGLRARSRTAAAGVPPGTWCPARSGARRTTW
ncbi:DNA-directed RNA polymerase specialized sigma24 family protein [Streptomyces sp. 3330]|nr:DNA-directed RNA polymerase specialized sigma24 family protein [Streptomyces sp. 3330]